MITCKVLSVFVHDVVTWAYDDRCTQLHRPGTTLGLAMAAGKRPNACADCGRAYEGAEAKLVGLDDLGCGAVRVEQHRERHVLVFDEGRCIATSSRADRRDSGARRKQLFVSVADLTGPFTARESPEVAKEEQHMGLVCPQVTQPLLCVVGSDKHLVAQEACVECHVGTPSGR